MRSLPTLYKLDSKNKTRVWNIKSNDPSGTYTVEHGTDGGKQQVTTVKVEQKNVGRANETTLDEQAELEARSKWQKQQDKGYVESNLLNVRNISHSQMIMEDAKKLLPMLAHNFEDHKHKIIYPVYVNKKYNGNRCLAYMKGNEVTLLSRKGKVFFGLQHIKDTIKPKLESGWVFDGELYVHGMSLQKVRSLVAQKKKVHEDEGIVEYHIYDCFNNSKPELSFSARKIKLDDLLRGASAPLFNVEAQVVHNEQTVFKLLKQFERDGYEGVIVRTMQGAYSHNRSQSLLKLKSFKDEEYEIVGGESGIGKFEGMCIFICKTKDNKLFRCMPEGSEEIRREYLTNIDKYISLPLTVRYYDKTDDGLPSFPIGVAVRPSWD